MTDQETELASIGLLLKSYRLRRGLSQERLGNDAGLGAQTVPQIEQGKRLPYFDTLRKMLVELQVSWLEFGRDMQTQDPHTSPPPRGPHGVGAGSS